MTIRRLKELIKDLPDDMRVYADDGNGLFSNNSEFVCLVYTLRSLYFPNDPMKCVLQTKNDIDVNEEVTSWCKYASENDMDELDFWIDFHEAGFNPDDFDDPIQREVAKKYMSEHGLI